MVHLSINFASDVSPEVPQQLSYSKSAGIELSNLSVFEEFDEKYWTFDYRL